MEKIRLCIFETNSSSSHSISLEEKIFGENYQNECKISSDCSSAEGLNYFVTSVEKLHFFERWLLGWKGWTEEKIDIEGLLGGLKVLLQEHPEFDAYNFAIDRPQSDRTILDAYPLDGLEEIQKTISNIQVTCQKIVTIVLDSRIIIEDQFSDSF